MNTPTSKLSRQNRYILTRVGEQELAFPYHWVAEIMVVERSQVLVLPFYNSAVLGVVYHQGKIVPLVSARCATAAKTSAENPYGEMLMVVRLEESLESLARVGIVIEEVIGSLSTEEVSEKRVFQLQDIPSNVWQPQRWKS